MTNKLSSIIIKSRAIILTQVKLIRITEPSSFSSLFNLPYSKDIHYLSQARHIVHSITHFVEMSVLNVKPFQNSEHNQKFQLK